MGRTRKKSSHNQGRKPLYKEHRRHLVDKTEQPVVVDEIARERIEEAGRLAAELYEARGRRLMWKDAVGRWKQPSTVPAGATVEQILSRPAFSGGMLFNNRLNWSETDMDKLRILADGDADLARSEIALGRPMKAIAWRARDMGLHLPLEWGRLVRPVYKPRVRAEPLLHFPFIKKTRPEHADILRANSLVPRGFSEDVRADICQSMMLALYEGTVTLEELEANKTSMRYFIGKFYKDQRPYQEVQIESRMEDEEPSYSMLAHLNDEHNEDQRAELRRVAAGYMDHQPATQVDDIYDHEMRATASISHTRGLHLEAREVRLLVEADEWNDHIGTYAMLHKRAHVGDRAINRFDMILTHDDRRKISEFCRGRPPAWKSYGDDTHFVKYKGHRICAIISGHTGDVKTVMPREWKPKWVDQ